MKASIKPKGLMVILALGCALFLPTVSMATSILGGSIFVQNTGEVTATFQGSSASYTSVLFLQGSNRGLFNSKSTGIGTTISLGTFEAGTELVFGLKVKDTGHTFFTGAGSRNADGLAHAWLDESFGEEGEALVGFEDLLGGGDGDYNDFEFSVSNVAATVAAIVASEEALNPDSQSSGGTNVSNPGGAAIPEPSTVILMGSGLIGLGAWQWRRNKKHQNAA